LAGFDRARRPRRRRLGETTFPPPRVAHQRTHKAIAPAHTTPAAFRRGDRKISADREPAPLPRCEVVQFLTGSNRALEEHQLLWSHAEAQRRRVRQFTCISAPLRENEKPQKFRLLSAISLETSQLQNVHDRPLDPRPEPPTIPSPLFFLVFLLVPWCLGGSPLLPLSCSSCLPSCSSWSRSLPKPRPPLLTSFA
jgi:hypothetical protein